MRLDYTKVVTALLETEESVPEIAQIVKESAEKEAEETDAMSYLMKLEEFLDDCGIYAFKGWEDAIVASEPVIDKFWVSFDFLLPKGVDLEASAHICGRDKEARVFVRKKDDILRCRIKVLRRVLDNIEFRNRKEAEKETKPVMDAPLNSPAGDAGAAPPGPGVPPI